MNAAPPSFVRCYLPLVGVGLAGAGIVAAIGYAAAPGDRAAVLAGCGASWVASCIGAAPTALALSTNPRGVATAVMASTALRFVVVLMLVVPLVLSGWFSKTLLVVFVAVSYMVILLVETVLAVRMVGRHSGEGSR